MGMSTDSARSGMDDLFTRVETGQHLVFSVVYKNSSGCTWPIPDLLLPTQEDAKTVARLCGAWYTKRISAFLSVTQNTSYTLRSLVLSDGMVLHTVGGLQAHWQPTVEAHARAFAKWKAERPPAALYPTSEREILETGRDLARALGIFIDWAQAADDERLECMPCIEQRGYAWCPAVFLQYTVGQLCCMHVWRAAWRPSRFACCRRWCQGDVVL